MESVHSSTNNSDKLWKLNMVQKVL